SGNNTFNASGLTGTPPVRVVFDGAGGVDTLTGGGANDTLIGGDGSDTLKGGAGDDTLYGGTNLNATDDSTSDTAVYDHGPVGYSVTFNGDGTVTVTDTNPGDGNEGSDTLKGIDLLDFNGTIIDLTANVLVFSSYDVGTSTGTLKASYSTIAAALAAAGTVDGDTIRVAAGTYSDHLDVNKDVTILGANAGIDGADSGDRGPETVITGGMKISDSGVTVDGVEISGSYDTTATPDIASPPHIGVLIGSANVTFKNSVFTPGDAFISRPFGTTGAATGFDFEHNLVHDWTRGAYFTAGSSGSITNNTFVDNQSG